MNLKKYEFTFLTQFVSEASFDEELARDQLRSLWTAYCFHNNLNVDTGSYDNDLLALWEQMTSANDGTELDTPDWCDYDSFDGFMCKYLV